MRLKISGIGKIGDSEIEMKGITVIAGENNTGKSTFGKVLYCMFNAFCNTKMAIHYERMCDISRIIHNNLFLPAVKTHAVDRLIIKLIDEMENLAVNKSSWDNIRKILEDGISKLTVENDNLFTMGTVDNIWRSLTVNDDEIQKAVVCRYFENEFDGNVNHINKSNTTGNITLVIQGKNIDVSIENNKCGNADDNVGIHHNAIYMDTPFIMDGIQVQPDEDSRPHYMVRYNSKINHRENLRNRLGKKYSNNTVIEEIIINKKTTGIMSDIRSIAKGEFMEDDGDLMFIEDGLNKPIRLSSVSAGIKTFLIIRRLLELGEIKERDVLILDEPEIHLHPSLQLQFAEILVLLQKELELTILLTTHSPYFLNAVETYSKRHSIIERVKYYLAENNGDTSDVQDVTNNVDAIYKQLATPFQTLDAIDDED
jgi:predicted ATPase